MPALQGIGCQPATVPIIYNGKPAPGQPFAEREAASVQPPAVSFQPNKMAKQKCRMQGAQMSRSEAYSSTPQRRDHAAQRSSWRFLQSHQKMIARHPCGTQRTSLPLLPPGPGGVHEPLLRRTRLSSLDPCWRRGGDSNPRYVAVHTISSRAPSASRSPLRVLRGSPKASRPTLYKQKTYFKRAKRREPPKRRWRRGWDSNPRSRSPRTGDFESPPLWPLRYLSGCVSFHGCRIYFVRALFAEPQSSWQAPFRVSAASMEAYTLPLSHSPHRRRQ